MSFESVLARISQLNPAFQDPFVAPATPPAQPAPSQPFSSYLPAAGGSDPTATVSSVGVPTVLADPNASLGQRLVSFAQAEIGQGETDPVNNPNESSAIERYKTATVGAQPNAPWCAYFVSYIAREAGAPLGEQGQGYGSVAEIRAWAQRTGHWLPGSATPQPGDLILFSDRHVGMVESVDSDGTVHTIEGNDGNMVARGSYPPGTATDYVQLG